ncbi:MAG: ATP-binding protein [Flavisolibacter sp.]
MLEFLDIRFSFLCRTTRLNKNGKNPIILRIIFRGQRRNVFTGIYCDNKEWNSSTGCIIKGKKDAVVINPNLERIKRKASDAFDEMRYSGESFSIDELVDKIKGKEEKPTLLIDFLEEGNKKMHKRVGVEITKATYYKYRKSLEYVQDYLLHHYKVKNYLLMRIDTKFLENYYYFLRTDLSLYDHSVENVLTKTRLNQLKELNWLDQVFNIILMGPSGTEKTFLAAGLCYEAATKGYKAYFRGMGELITMLKTKDFARSAKRGL